MSIILQPIIEKEDSVLKQIYEHYIEAFPPAERRSEQQFYDLVNHSKSNINSILLNDEYVGYIVTWDLNDAIFIEHFEVFPTHRGKKIGEKVLEHLIQDNMLVLLETEPNDYGEMATRRIKFYERNGFTIIDKNHVQPAYALEKDPLTLFLMANDEIDNYEEVMEELYKTVYEGLV
ncbi:GNAT family N-acetyltransferase [Flavobacteriaceae bacterium Ap0902]|nr:GNAT family N-acetyltransferase [Flavobacteriaceae bacterium Ap0902]